MKRGGKKKSDGGANESESDIGSEIHNHNQQQQQQQQKPIPQNQTEKTIPRARGGEQHETLVDFDDDVDDVDDVVDVSVTHTQPPKQQLDDGFYEIEAIRRKRMRKGQLQYLIKWRGWPETANTWEPLDNLQSVPDVIDAFEQDCLRSGKQRRRKRKHVVHHTHTHTHAQPTKRHHRSITSYSLRRFPTQTDGHSPLADPPLSDPPAHPQTVIFADEAQTSSHPTTLATPQQPQHIQNQRNEQENDYDPKLSELRAITNNGVDDTDNLAIHVSQANTSAGNGHQEDDDSKVGSMDPVQSDRCRGAKRRKSGSVKRFKCPSEPHDTRNPASMSVGAVEPGRTGITRGGKNCNAGNIVKIIKPIGYSASLSGNTQDVLVTLIAVRSDGTEVLVDNKYLKEHNPLLLINFYEQHLRYIPVTERV